MSDSIKHECGIALIKLKKPYQYYIDKYNTATYGLNKLYLLMEKQHNRGQDGAGVGILKLDTTPGQDYIYRIRSVENQAIQHIFSKAFAPLKNIEKEKLKDAEWLKNNVSSVGELMLGHLRYGTHGVNTEEACHPFYRKNNWITRNVILAGNFNLTNVDEQIEELIQLGQHPRKKADTITVLEKIGHFLDVEVQTEFDKYKKLGYSNLEITTKIAQNLDVQKVLTRAAVNFDGGFAMAGMIGHGDAFVLRDAHGIRPAYYFQNDEVVVVASERPCIQTAFGASIDEVKEVTPGCALIIKKNGDAEEKRCIEEKPRMACSFERIYFSRGTDKDIYEERKNLGTLLAPLVLKSINHEIENAVFSFIPNTSETAFYGLVKGIEDYTEQKKIEIIRTETDDEKIIERIKKYRPRVEKIAVKDVKMRTFITEDTSRDELVSHVYDITYGCIREHQDTLVVIDDSIVRGTTLKKSIISNLVKLKPKKIVIVSSAPQIRYPDCYGIDMSKLGEFVAFKALIALLKENKKEHLLKQTYEACIEENKRKDGGIKNRVKELYAHFTVEEISKKVAEIIKPEGVTCDIEVVYQTIENLHEACPNNKGDWYFTGKYPTPGGNKVSNKAFINFYEGKNERAY